MVFHHFPWFSHDFPWFPMIFPRFSHDFPWFSHDFPMIFHHFPMVFLWFSHSKWWLSHGFPGTRSSSRSSAGPAEAGAHLSEGTEKGLRPGMPRRLGKAMGNLWENGDLPSGKLTRLRKITVCQMGKLTSFRLGHVQHSYFDMTRGYQFILM